MLSLLGMKALTIILTSQFATSLKGYATNRDGVATRYGKQSAISSGTDETDIRSWKLLCRSLGIIQPPATLEKCQEACPLLLKLSGSANKN